LFVYGITYVTGPPAKARRCVKSTEFSLGWVRRFQGCYSGKDKRRHDLHADAEGLAMHALRLKAVERFLPPNTLEARQNLVG